MRLNVSKGLVVSAASLVLLFSAAEAAPQRFVSADTQVQLIELYTSEGCSSCPPADKRLAKLKHDKSLWSERVPVAFHVDYWDYIGWADPFATPENSKRQRAHAARGNVANVYTPSFVVDGEEWRGFFRRGRLPRVSKKVVGPLTLDYENGRVEVNFKPANSKINEFQLHLAWLGAGLEVAVSNGENSGRQLKHDFVALKRQESVLSGSDGFTFSGEFNGDRLVDAEQYALVAWVEDAQGRSMQAVGGWALP